MKKKVVGYIVVGPNGVFHLDVNPYSLRDHVGQNILWLGGPGTLFSSRRRANRALARTIEYACRKGYDWPWLRESYVLSVVKDSR
jgi:hypothetical protein